MYPTQSNGTGLKSFNRHATTAAQAIAAEDGPSNPFTGKKLSERYFDILKTRRNLPVHAQRQVTFTPDCWPYPLPPQQRC